MPMPTLKQIVLCLVKPERHTSFGALCFCAIAAAAATVLTATTLRPEAGTIRHEEMVTLSGRVMSLHTTSSGVRFQLSGHSTPLIYDGRSRPHMHQALREAGDAIVTIERNPESRDPRDDEEAAFPVWSIRVGDQSVLSLEAVREDRRSNVLLGRVMFPFFLAVAVYWTYLAWKKKRKERYPFG